jgi:hypothetical protein
MLIATSERKTGKRPDPLFAVHINITAHRVKSRSSSLLKNVISYNMSPRLTIEDHVRVAAGCSKRPSRKAAASEGPEAYPLGYVEGLNDAKTPLADFFSILLGKV